MSPYVWGDSHGVRTCYPLWVSAIERLADLGPERLRSLRRAEYDKMVESGFFRNERVELLGGMLVEMSPQNPRHANAIQRLNDLLAPALAGRASVRVQLPLALTDDSEPEPDIAVVTPGTYRDAHPRTALLVAEVAGESLQKDRRFKADLYAAAGVPEYWVVNLRDDLIEVHLEPLAGTYTRVTPYASGEMVRPRAFPDVEVPVSAVVE
jgi:Uma2 family endonuclease